MMPYATKVRGLKLLEYWALSYETSPDLEYYVLQLVAFVRRVLEVVPTNMFVLLNDIIAVQTRSMKMLPARLERAELREFAQFEERYRLARSTHQVSAYGEMARQQK